MSGYGFTAAEMAAGIAQIGELVRRQQIMFLQVVPVEEALERLEDYVARKGKAPTPQDGRQPGWLLRDIEHVCRELRLQADKPRPKKPRGWLHAWGLFDRRQGRA